MLHNRDLLKYGRSLIRSYLDNRDGSMAVVMAVMLVVLMAAIGGALDFGRASLARDKTQGVLDAALLHAAGRASQSKVAAASAFFEAESKNLGIAGPDPTFVLGADGSVSGAASMSIETIFLRIVGMQMLPVVVKGTATANIATVTQVAFTPATAQGWYAKDVYAFIRDANGNIIEQTKVLSYDYDYSTGTKTTVPALNQQSQTYTLTGGASFGVMLRVWPDTVHIGSRSGPYVDYYSDDPNPNMLVSGNCKTGETHSWEDGGNQSYGDFVYVMSCSSMVGEPKFVRLTQ
jgi:Flp pilus assembly protein TadG